MRRRIKLPIPEGYSIRTIKGKQFLIQDKTSNFWYKAMQSVSISDVWEPAFGPKINRFKELFFSNK